MHGCQLRHPRKKTLTPVRAVLDDGFRVRNLPVQSRVLYQLSHVSAEIHDPHTPWGGASATSGQTTRMFAVRCLGVLQSTFSLVFRCIRPESAT